MRKTIHGIKLGSNYSVGYGVGIDPENPKSTGPRVELTCIAEVPAHLLEKDINYIFSREADLYHNAKYPLEYGLPKGDTPAERLSSVGLLRTFNNWFLQGIPEETGIVYCLPMMKYQEGLNNLKTTLNKQKKGTIGKRYIMEAWAAALATVGIQESLRSQVISLNFGSSTLEVVLYVGKKMIAQNVYPFGGMRIDNELQSAISQANRGIHVTESQARTVKEQYDFAKKKAVPGLFTKDGKLVNREVTSDVIDPVLQEFASDVANHVARYFLRDAARKSQKAVSAIQTEGMGYVCICGGLSNMPGFPELVAEEMKKSGALNPDLKVSYPTDPDGVTAPAYGALQLADLLEEQRENSGLSSWDDKPKK